MGHGYQNQCGSISASSNVWNSDMQKQKNDKFSLLTLHGIGAQSIAVEYIYLPLQSQFFEGRTRIKTLVFCTSLIPSIHGVWFCGMFCLRNFQLPHRMEIMLKYLPGLYLFWFFILAKILHVTWLKLKCLSLDLEMIFRLRLFKIKGKQH